MSSASLGPDGSGATDGKEATKARLKRRQELYELNSAAWERNDPPESSSKLDSSLKRHTGLLNKLRTSINIAANVPAILKEIQGLSLEKYIEEAVGASIEGLSKCKNASEIYAAVEVISALHQRFPDVYGVKFTSQLIAAFPLAPSSATDKDIREKEESARISKLRTLVRVLGEAEIVGIVKGKGDTTLGVLKDVLTADKENLAAVAPVAIAFAKYLGSAFFPGSSGEDEKESTLVQRATQEKALKLVTAYYEGLSRRESREHLEMQKQDKRNHEAYIRSGEIFEDREKAYEKRLRAWERGWAYVTTLSELLKLPVPALPSLSSAVAKDAVVTSGTSGAAAKGEFDATNSLWLDEEEKKFYEDLRDLRGEVPAALLGAQKADAKVEAPENTPATATETEADAAVEPVDVAVGDADKAAEEPAAGPGAQLTTLLARLPDASSRANIDEIARDFALLNSKAARRRLVKTLAAVDRNRQDLLPYYARLVATLDPHMPDIAKELIGILDEEFRYLQRKRPAELIESRTKNLRFLSELTKFGLVPEHTLFHTFKVLLDDLRDVNVDSLCVLLENCGRYLLRSEGTRDRMRQVLETLKRKTSSMNFDSRQTMMLDNARYQCDPPERPAIAPKVRTPIELFLRHLFYHVLARNTCDKVLKIVRKLDWDDALVKRKLHNAFTKVWKIKFSNVHLFAVLLRELNRYHPDFIVMVIDDVLEHVRVGSEENNFKFNQQRVATIKYLGEMYNYRVVDATVVLNTLWSLATFGHPDGRPRPELASPIDSPDDFFRIRLVCTMLDSCGQTLDKSPYKSRLDTFLTFFQMYILSKGHAPMDVGFMITDTFETLRPKEALFQTYVEAAVRVDELLAEQQPAEPVQEVVEPAVQQAASDSGSSMDMSDDETDSQSETEKEDSDDESDSDDDDGSSVHAEEEDDAFAEPRRDPSAMTAEEEDEFSRELAKMMTVSGGDTRKPADRKALTDLSIPFVRRGNAAEHETAPAASSTTTTTTTAATTDPSNATSTSTGSGMKFTLLTKKGAKQQTMTLEVPLEAPLAVQTLQKQAQDKAEQLQLKQLVLDYERREQQTEKDALKETMARRGINLRFVGGDRNR